jgi:hypothetical protein
LDVNGSGWVEAIDELRIFNAINTVGLPARHTIAVQRFRVNLEPVEVTCNWCWQRRRRATGNDFVPTYFAAAESRRYEMPAAGHRSAKYQSTPELPVS